MSKEEVIRKANKELIELGNLEIIPETFAKNYKSYNSNKVHEGHDLIVKWVKQIHKALPGIKVVNIEFFLQTNDTIVWQRTLQGKHTTKAWGINPSDKEIKWNEMVVSRFNGYKIAEEWVVSELVGELLTKKPKNKKN